MNLLSGAIVDVEIGATPIEIIRKIYRKEQGVAVLQEEKRIQTVGTVHPAKMEEIALMPEEYRGETVVQVHTGVLISTGKVIDERSYFGPDEIVVGDEQYKVVAVKDWMQFGFCKAMAVKMKG